MTPCVFWSDSCQAHETQMQRICCHFKTVKGIVFFFFFFSSLHMVCNNLSKMHPTCGCIHEVSEAYLYLSADASVCSELNWIWTITVGSVPSVSLLWQPWRKMLSCKSNLGSKLFSNTDKEKLWLNPFWYIFFCKQIFWISYIRILQ